MYSVRDSWRQQVCLLEPIPPVLHPACTHVSPRICCCLLLITDMWTSCQTGGWTVLRRGRAVWYVNFARYIHGEMVSGIATRSCPISANMGMHGWLWMMKMWMHSWLGLRLSLRRMFLGIRDEPCERRELYTSTRLLQGLAQIAKPCRNRNPQTCN